MHSYASIKCLDDGRKLGHGASEYVSEIAYDIELGFTLVGNESNNCMFACLYVLPGFQNHFYCIATSQGHHSIKCKSTKLS